MTAELGPSEGMNALRHQDCRFCDEYERLIRGRDAEIKALKTKLADVQSGSAEPAEEKRYGSIEEIKREFLPRLWEAEQEEARRRDEQAGEFEENLRPPHEGGGRS